MRSRRAHRPSEGGFALLIVVILLALMTAATALSLDNAVASLRTIAGTRASEMIKSAADFGVSEAIAQLQVDDVEVITDPALYPGIGGANSFDIFNAAGAALNPTPYIPPLTYPPASVVPTHPMVGDYGVRVGLRTAQRARPPAGEDVRTSYGQVVEVQVEVQSNIAGVPPVQERVSVGVVIPRRQANAK